MEKKGTYMRKRIEASKETEREKSIKEIRMGRGNWEDFPKYKLG